MKEYGRIGQKRWEGQFYEEFLPELSGMRGIKVFQEMKENDDTVGAILFAIKMLIRQVEWHVEPGGDSAKDKEAAEFVESCMDDMQATWTDTISEILSFLPYGWSFHEIVYKRRMGKTKNRRSSSKYSDGLIGWQKLPPRAQDTLYRWEYDDSDNLIGMTQQPPPDYGLFTIPMSKASLSSDNYYEFSKEDLLRDNWSRKPAYGKVDPTVVGESMKPYVCQVDQMIMGIDQIRQTDLSRRQGPTTMQPKQQRVKTIAEQANIHQDRLFAESYFKAGAWKNELEGVDNTSPSTNQFIKFSNANSDPIAFIDSEKTSMNQQTGRMPNRIGLGINVFNALKVHPAILERVKYGGSTANPASVTENVLAQLFGVEKIAVLKSIMNNAGMGEDENMQYIGDPDAFLLAYATNAPSIDEPSAGYIFTWDMLGNGQMLPILNYLGENGTHTEYVEGLMATDMHKTSDDLARFYKSAV